MKGYMSILFGSLLVLVLSLGSMNYVDAIPCDTHERDDGKIVCLSESTATKLMERGWNITKIVNDYPLPVTDSVVVEKINTEKLIPQVNQTVQVIGTVSIENNITKNTTKQTPEIIQQIPVIPSESNTYVKKIGWLYEEKDLSYMQLKKIPNPTGFWTPIEDKDEFARLLVNATGDEIIEKSSSDSLAYYDTENGKIKMRHHFSSLLGNGLGPVMYDIKKSIQDESEQLEFINSFMKNMGLKFNNGIPLTVEFLESCEGTSLTSSCEWGDGSLYALLDKYSQSYSIKQQIGKVEFFFYTDAYTKYGLAGITIVLYNWTDNPELVEFSLKPEDVKKIAYDFAATHEELNKPSSQGGECEFKLIDNPNEISNLRHYILGGVPFYGLHMGGCTYDPTGTGHQQMPEIIVDAWDGNFTSIIYGVVG